MRFYVSTATFFLLHSDEWDRVVALPRHKFVTGATLLQLVLIFSKFSINEDRLWHFQQRILQNINVFFKISKESTSFYHIHEKYSVSSTFLNNGNAKCYVVRILYAISFQWSKCFGYRGQQIILKLTITDSRCWQSGTTVPWILISDLSCNKLSHLVFRIIQILKFMANGCL